jgi:ribosomal protein L40E
MTIPDPPKNTVPHCPGCNAPLPPDAALCQSCGLHLNDDTTAPDSPEETSPLIRVDVRVCRRCGMVNIPERHTCKRCRAPLPAITQRNEWQPQSRGIVLPTPVVLCIAAGLMALLVYNTFFPSPPTLAPFSLEATISRGYRVIAIEDPEAPAYRWVISEPNNYTVVGDSGVHAEHQPAQITYGTQWSNPAIQQGSTRGTNLSAEEWQQVVTWQQIWCRERTADQQAITAPSKYVIAMRCQGYTATIFRVPQTAVPIKIAHLLQRASQ